ncbi:hypothetical protein CI109_101197 [Kwoniella shandongensis]|uniref:Uncharacterized protein n=1 Tax=Kwoniella shandongensis TaxID=1734106 RepID=A0A5M6BTS0_9TREE|nr:uncharacterized protein CI109_005485 [Kwoniella shandongensis]KAA5526207.1 hypothetical protein CI109_005485 [Kwoniella shandongensis]
MSDATTAASGETSSGPKYNLETLSEHKTRESCWMLLHDKVYDVTAFLDEHPGGDEVMLEECGRDATEAFEDVGHSDEARDMLPKMFLGDFDGPKSAKAAKRAAANGGSTSAASSGFPIWILPVSVLAAFIAWRVLYA